MPDFANILLAGPCNRRCPFCIGKRLPARVNRDNLDEFPPRGIDRLIDAVNSERIRDVVVTGTTTDPQLYRHEDRLLDLLRSRLHRGARIALHTNGALALRKMRTFNRYDRPCVSFPSFSPVTYERMMGSRRVPDLRAIVERAERPVKVSAIVTRDNEPEIPSFLWRLRDIGVRRVVLRRPYSDDREFWPLGSSRALRPMPGFRGNPRFDLGGMEVTLWDFARTRMTSLNLFADGTLGTSYHLTETPEFATAEAEATG